MESDRAPAVQPDQHQLGRQAADDFARDARIDSQRHDQDGASRQRLAQSRNLRKESKSQQCGDEGAELGATARLPQVELYYPAATPQRTMKTTSCGVKVARLLSRLRHVIH